MEFTFKTMECTYAYIDSLLKPIFTFHLNGRPNKKGLHMSDKVLLYALFGCLVKVTSKISRGTLKLLRGHG